MPQYLAAQLVCSGFDEAGGLEMKSCAKALAILLGAVLCSLPAWPAGGSQSQSDAPPKPSPTVERAVHQMFAVRQISEAVISPDGRHVAWVESLPGKNGALSSNSAIYVADWKSAAIPKRVTAAPAGVPAEENDVAWSPDSGHLAFFSNAGHGGQAQLYVMALDGAPKQLTHIKGDFSSPQWSPDGKSISFLYIENAP